MPDLVGRDLATIDKMSTAAGVVPIIEHQPGAAGRAGTVVRVEPPAGTAIPLGATITVAVAGAPSGTLDDLVAADRRSFVGLGADPDGTLVIAVAAGTDADAALRRIEPALAGRKHRVVRVQGDIPAGVVTALRAAYSGAVLVEPGGAARRAPRG